MELEATPARELAAVKKARALGRPGPGAAPGPGTLRGALVHATPASPTRSPARGPGSRTTAALPRRRLRERLPPYRRGRAPAGAGAGAAPAATGCGRGGGVSPSGEVHRDARYRTWCGAALRDDLTDALRDAQGELPALRQAGAVYRADSLFEAGADLSDALVGVEQGRPGRGRGADGGPQGVPVGGAPLAVCSGGGTRAM